MISDPAKSADHTLIRHEAAMQRGSRMLLQAMGGTPGPADLLWTDHSIAEQVFKRGDPNSKYGLRQARRLIKTEERTAENERLAEVIRICRDPCTRCGVRADLHADFGCKEGNRKLIHNPTADQVNQAWESEIASVIARRGRWTDSDLAALRAAYEGASCGQEIGLSALAEQLGRQKANVCRKARQLGLTDNARKQVPERKDRRKYKTADDLHVARSNNSKRQIRENGHPRGMAGKSHSDETKVRIGKKSKALAAVRTADERGEIAARAVQTKIARYGSAVPNHPAGSWKAGWREIGGRRNYYRSRWEANYARYLEWLKSRGEISDWQHEPETFWFDAIKRGVRSYLPDFRVWENNGATPLHEVKGWMDARSKTTLKRMSKYHPNERIVVIREKDYNAIARTVGRMIEGWESGGRADRP